MLASKRTDTSKVHDYGSRGGKAIRQRKKCGESPFQTYQSYGEKTVFNGKAVAKAKRAPAVPDVQENESQYVTTFGQSYGVEDGAHRSERLRKNQPNTEECVTRDWTTTQDAIGKHFSGGEAVVGGAKAVLAQQRSKVKGTVTHEPWTTTQREVGSFEAVPQHRREIPQPQDFFPEEIEYTTTNQEMLGRPAQPQKSNKARARIKPSEPNPYKTTSQLVGSHAKDFQISKTEKSKEMMMRSARSRADDYDILGQVDPMQEAQVVKQYSNNALQAFNSFLMPGGMDRSKCSKLQTALAYPNSEAAARHVAYQVKKRLGDLNMQHILDE